MSRIMVVLLLLVGGCEASEAPSNTLVATVILADGSQIDFSGTAAVAQETIEGDAVYNLGAANHVAPYSLGLLWDTHYLLVPGSVPATSVVFSLSDGLKNWRATAGTVTFMQLTNKPGSVVSGAFEQITLSDSATPPTSASIPNGAFNATLP